LGKQQLTISFLAGLALCGFAGNSLLCRLALGADHIDPIGFTLLRIWSGAFALAVIVAVSVKRGPKSEDWASASRCSPMLCSSRLRTVRFLQTPALYFVWLGSSHNDCRRDLQRRAGEPHEDTWPACGRRWTDRVAPAALWHPIGRASIAMGGAGVAWGVYTLRGRGAADPLDTTAATLQLGVPILTSIAGIPLLGEPVTLSLMISTALTLGGIAKVVIPLGKKY
jgi:hypothetical protein